MPAELDTGPLSFIRSNTVDHHVPSDLAVAERKRAGVQSPTTRSKPGSVDLILYDNLGSDPCCSLSSPLLAWHSVRMRRRGAIAAQLRDLMGRESADLVQTVVESAGKSSGFFVSLVGAIGSSYHRFWRVR